MKKTAMQEMHDELMAKKYTLPIWLILKCEELLEKEKDQIIDAYQVSHISMMTAEQYYNETFNTKE